MRFVRHEATVTRRVADETVIVPVRNNVADLESIYTLNATASWVWERLDGSRSVGELVDALTAEFDVMREEARRDVEVLVNDLQAEGLVRLADAEAGNDGAR